MDARTFRVTLGIFCAGAVAALAAGRFDGSARSDPVRPASAVRLASLQWPREGGTRAECVFDFEAVDEGARFRVPPFATVVRREASRRPEGEGGHPTATRLVVSLDIEEACKAGAVLRFDDSGLVLVPAVVPRPGKEVPRITVRETVGETTLVAPRTVSGATREPPYVLCGRFRRIALDGDELFVNSGMSDEAIERVAGDALVMARRLRANPSLKRAGSVRAWVVSASADMGSGRRFASRMSPVVEWTPGSEAARLRLARTLAEGLLRAAPGSAEPADDEARLATEAFLWYGAMVACGDLERQSRTLVERYRASFPVHPALAQARSAAERETIFDVRAPLFLLERDERNDGRLDGDVWRTLSARDHPSGLATMLANAGGERVETVAADVRHHFHDGQPILWVPRRGPSRAGTGGSACSPRFPLALDMFVSSRNQGYLDLCGCVASQKGGLARRAQVLRESEKAAGAVPLYVDLGDFTPQRDEGKPENVLRDETLLQLHALARMSCAVLVPSLNDLAWGPWLLESAREAGVPVVLTNVRPNGAAGGTHPADRIVVRSGGLRIGVLGTAAFDLSAVDWWDAERRVRRWADVQDPVVAILRALEGDWLDGVDLVLLLGQLSMSDAEELIPRLPAAVPCIVVTSNPADLRRADDGPGFRISPSSRRVDGVPVIVCKMGTYGVDRIAVGGTPRRLDYASRGVPLGMEITPDAEVHAMVRSHYEKFSRDPALLESLVKFREFRGAFGDASYVGADACATCHSSSTRGWRATRHSRAFETLRSHQSEYFPECYVCHVTGFGREDGYRVGRGAFEGVQCEVCHGPASGHVASKGAEPVPLRGTEPGLCVECHHGKHSPGFSADGRRYLERVAAACRGGGPAGR